MKKTKQERVEVVNQLIEFISKRGRRFFFNHSKNKVAQMCLRNNRVYFVDHTTGAWVYAYPGYEDRSGFSHGGTLWALVCEFSEFIRTGKDTNGVHGYGGLHSGGWGHSEEIQKEIIAYAREIGYLPPKKPRKGLTKEEVNALPHTKQLTEDVKVGMLLIKNGKLFSITDTYEVNGEGMGFVLMNENGRKQKISASCGTYLLVVDQ